MSIIGLADCNNFFVSCERTVHPELRDRAVVVLSNNDGCVVARSNEAKAMGVKMGQPAFEIKDLIKSGQLVACSGHHMLYKNISVAVHKIFARYAPSTIDYSVDEAFLDMNGIPEWALREIGEDLVRVCYNELQIPVTIGFAPTKTLAKICTERCKMSRESVGILLDKDEIDQVLDEIEIKDLWGVGRRLSKRMYMAGIHTCGDFARCDMHRIRKEFGVNGEKSWRELHGQPCISLDHVNRKRQDSISESRTFPTDTDDYNYLRTRIAMYADHCAQRLMSMGCVCRSITVWLATNRFKNDHYYPQVHVLLDKATAYAPTLISAACDALLKIYRPEFMYKRAGLILEDITPAASEMRSLFEEEESENRNQPLEKEVPKEFLDVIKKLNTGHSKPVIPLASEMIRSHDKSNDGYSSSFQFRK